MNIQQYFKKKHQFRNAYSKLSLEDLRKELIEVDKEMDKFTTHLAHFYTWSETWLKKQDIFGEFHTLFSMQADVTDRYMLGIAESDQGGPDPEIYSLGNDTVIFVISDEDGTPYAIGRIDAKSILKTADIQEALALFYYVHYSNWSPQTTRERFDYGVGETCLSDIGSNMPTDLARYYVMIADIIKAMSEKAPAYL